MRFLLIVLSCVNLLVFIGCSSSQTEILHKMENFRDRSSIWWRHNSFYNEAIVKWLKQKHQIEKRLKAKEQERLNLNLIENLLKKAQATLLQNSLEIRLT
jgi:cytochrome b subunit of formate dehydrogenase